MSMKSQVLIIGESLIAAHARGVDVKILVEGGPVGGISQEENMVIRNLSKNGIPVNMMVSLTGRSRSLSL